MGKAGNGSAALPWLSTLIFATLWLATGTNAQQCDARDSAALVAFKADFLDPLNVFATWAPGTNCCNWAGVTCDATGRVSALRLDAGQAPRQDTPDPNRNSARLVGSSIGDLSALVVFNDSATAFNGPIPSSWAGLVSLQQLRLGNPGFSGTIPDFLGKLPKITVISILGGALTGAIPTSLCNQNLQELAFTGNQLSGPLPGCLASLANLQVLNFADNRIGGIIPLDLSGLTKLVQFLLGGNRLTGIIPPSIGSLSSLQTADFSQNLLNGILPLALGNLKSLQNFVASNNFLTGFLPSTIGQLGQLQGLDLSFNQLTGTLPAGIGNLLSLSSLNLSNNLFLGTIDPIGQLGQVSTKLPSIDISFNGFTGVLPNTLQLIGNFVASNNFFIGGVPLSLTANAQTIDLSFNSLFDVRPYGSVLGNPKTSVLSLAFNRLIGPIPTWLPQISRLTQIDISNNLLTGPIPVDIFVLPNLISLNISNNPLSAMLTVIRNGAVLSSPLTSLDLHNDQFFGLVPINFLRAFPNIQFLDLSGNPLLTGTIPRVP